MIKSGGAFSHVLLAALISVVLAGSAAATATQFTVPAGEETTRPLNLAVEDRVFIKFAVVGQTENTLDFFITSPNGSIMVEFLKQGVVQHSFICEKEGEYVLHFSNTYSPESKFVTLDYEVQHYILGIPQMLFLTIIIAIVCVAAVAVFILMGRPH